MVVVVEGARDNDEVWQEDGGGDKDEEEPAVRRCGSGRRAAMDAAAEQ